MGGRGTGATVSEDGHTSRCCASRDMRRVFASASGWPYIKNVMKKARDRGEDGTKRCWWFRGCFSKALEGGRPNWCGPRFRSKAGFPSCEVPVRESPAPECRAFGNAIPRVPQENGMGTATRLFVPLSLSLAQTGRAMAPVSPVRDLSRSWLVTIRRLPARH